MTDTITLPRSVVEQALEAFENHAKQYPHMQKGYTVDAANTLRAALEQPQVEQEPFTILVRKRSWVDNLWDAAPRGFPDYGKEWADERINVYTHPQPLRQPLTDEQIACIEDGFSNEFGLEAKHSLDFARAIERAHGIGGKV